MPLALARHDALVRGSIEVHQGTVVKMTGDGVCAAFGDPLQAIAATLQLQQALADPEGTNGVALRVRCGMHLGVVARRDNDYFGSPVNRAARIMAAAHGGQVLVSQAVVEVVRERLPPGVSLRDLGSVRLRDLASPGHVYQIMHPLLRQDFPALRSLEVTPNNLPPQLTSFVGRESDLAEYAQILGQTRLLTLSGIGGCGKTRLAIKLAEAMLPSFADGVCFVDFAPIAEPERVALCVATAFGVREESDKPIEETLIRHLADRQLLLVLDNCEHLLSACAALAERLLLATPKLHVLVTSREGFGIAGERVVPVRSLSLPARATEGVEALLHFEAVRLFVDRVKEVAPEFDLALRQCRRSRRDLPPARRHSAGARARSGASEAPVRRADSREAQ